MNRTEAYGILGLNRGASLREVDRAWERQSTRVQRGDLDTPREAIDQARALLAETDDRVREDLEEWAWPLTLDSDRSRIRTTAELGLPPVLPELGPAFDRLLAGLPAPEEIGRYFAACSLPLPAEVGDIAAVLLAAMGDTPGADPFSLVPSPEEAL
ncbi:MAG TPA: hypothetical protein VGK74_00460 [Symbiobacteriaceae bacterium]|jgi:hypothetical protein